MVLLKMDNFNKRGAKWNKFVKAVQKNEKEREENHKSYRKISPRN